MTVPVCLISGVGPGTGSALARKFAEGGYRVAMLARSEERLAALEKELPNAKGYRCDASDPAQVESEQLPSSATSVVPTLSSTTPSAEQSVRSWKYHGLPNRNFQVNAMG